MKKRIFRGASFILLTLSIPAIGWGIIDNSALDKAKTEIKKQSVPTAVSNVELFDQYVSEIYDSAKLNAALLDYNVFKKAVTGYYNFKSSGKALGRPVISVVDFSKASTEKRIWIIDLEKKALLFNTFVAHGQGSGDNYATAFSNTTDSHQSSLGFYITSNTYIGKHGLSLKLNGMDDGYNTNAYNRAVVVHGADYVSQEFINQRGRLGRSYGCPALPVALTPSIIQAIKGHTVLFINGSDNDTYTSNYLDEQIAANLMVGAGSSLQAASL